MFGIKDEINVVKSADNTRQILIGPAGCILGLSPSSSPSLSQWVNVEKTSRASSPMTVNDVATWIDSDFYLAPLPTSSFALTPSICLLH